MEIEVARIKEVLERVDARWSLRSLRPLSRRARLLRVDSEDRAEQLVLLTHGEADRAFNPDIARDEYRLLQILSAAGLPVAGPLALAEDHEPPFLITSFVRGAPRFAAEDVASFCRQLAGALGAIHAVDIAEHDLSFLSRLSDAVAAALAEGRGEGRIRAALRAALGGLRWHESALLHGDFWLGNLHWEGDALSGIVDWEDAMLGDPLADLGKSRLEMLWALGAEAMERYTADYLALNDGLEASSLPVWDLWGAARLAHFASFAEDAEAAGRMKAQYDEFVEAALEAL